MKRLLLHILLVCCAGAAASADPFIVAHRGASNDAPENTLPAFKLAWELDADAAEGDFHLTKDGRVVCIHDKDTKRVAGKKLIVRNSTLAELRALDVGAWRGEKFKGAIVPTLAEVLETVPAHKKIFVEVKCGPEIIPSVIDAFEKSKLEKEQQVVVSFNASVVKAMKKQAPQYTAYWLAKFKKNKAGELKPTLETVLRTLVETKADGLDCNWDGVPEDIAMAVKNLGYELHVYTVNSPEDALKMVALGVHSITTDKPAKIKEAVKSN